MGYWPWPYVLMTLIWWKLRVIKAVKFVFQCLTLDGQNWPWEKNIQNSATWDLGVWSERFYAFSALSYQNCRTSSKKCEKIHKNYQFITRKQLNRFSNYLETYDKKLLFWRCIYMSNVLMIGFRESDQKLVTDRWTDVMDGRIDGPTDGRTSWSSAREYQFLWIWLITSFYN